VALAVAPLLAIFHQASVRHAVCEHGDLIESDSRATHDDSVASRAGVDAALGAVARFLADEAPAAHGHTHCSVGTLAKSAARVVAPAAALEALADDVLAVPLHGEVAYLRPVLPNAPKTSPPMVASILG
jgi:hypothetical protein